MWLLVNNVRMLLILYTHQFKILSIEIIRVYFFIMIVVIIKYKFKIER